MSSHITDDTTDIILMTLVVMMMLGMMFVMMFMMVFMMMPVLIFFVCSSFDNVCGNASIKQPIIDSQHNWKWDGANDDAGDDDDVAGDYNGEAGDGDDVLVYIK